MKLLIDIREKDLIILIPNLIEHYGFNYEIEIKNLALGDFIIEDDSGKEIIIIERKSLNDLAASIRDGRYREQSLRLTSNEIHNHNIQYIIEGSLKTYGSKYSKISTDTLLSSMISLNYYKGFSVIRTMNMNETGNYIVRLLDKVSKETLKGSKPYFRNCNTNSDENNIVEKTDNNEVCEKLQLTLKEGIKTEVQMKSNMNQPIYSSVVKKVKKDNITPENIGEIILSQIPGISSVTSLAIMQYYGSLMNLINNLQKDKNCLEGFTMTTTTGQKRKLSKTAINSIVNYLMYMRETEISI